MTTRHLTNTLTVYTTNKATKDQLAYRKRLKKMRKRLEQQFDEAMKEVVNQAQEGVYVDDLCGMRKELKKIENIFTELSQEFELATFVNEGYLN